MRQNYEDRDAQAVIVSKHDAGAGADAAITVPADKEQFWVIDWILWSYSTDPATAGTIRIEYNGVIVSETDVTRGGPGLLQFRDGLYNAQGQNKAPRNEEMVVTLVGVSGATAKLTVRYR